MSTFFKRFRAAALAVGIAATTAAAPSAAHANWGGAIGHFWTRVTHVVGPDINKGVNHLVGEVQKSWDWQPRPDQHPVHVVNPFAPAPVCDTNVEPVGTTPGPKIGVFFENVSSFPKWVEIYDMNSNGWVFGGSVAPWAKVPVELTANETGYANAELRIDHHCEFVQEGLLDPGETIKG